MLQNLQIPDSLVAELVEIEVKLRPLETRKEELKEALRALGANTYTTTDGAVTVSVPSVPRKTGTRLAHNEPLWPLLTPETKADCLKTGFIFTEDVFSRASKARVEIIIS